MKPSPATSNSPAPLRLVVGCGYLGERVARLWLAAGSRVCGVTRRGPRAAELSALGMEPVVADVTAAGADAWHWVATLGEIATVFWAVGFDRTAGQTHRDVHVSGFGRLLDALPAGPRVILSSSTGVWADESGAVVDEDTPTNPDREAGRVLLEAESLLRSHRTGPGVALRFAGLYGPGRLPRIDALRAGQPIAADPDSWLNLIHVDDAARVVHAVAEAPAPAPLYVVSDAAPVRRRDWYVRLAEATNSPPPTWNVERNVDGPRPRSADKRVNPARLFRDLPVRLSHPDALTSLAEIIRDGR